MNMKRRQIRSDFADELIVEEQAGQGYVHTQKKGRSIHVSHICVQDADNPLQKPPGDYISISFASLHDRLQRTELIDALQDHLALLMNAAEGSIERVLVVGLGNREIVSDALGPQVASQLLVTAHLYEQKETDWLKGTRNVAVLAPGVMGQTGLESSVIIEQVAKRYRPDLVIVIDALATRHLQRINRVIQLSNTGLQPGSGIGNHRRRIDAQTLHVPVLAIGVATVTSIYAVLEEALGEEQAADAFVTLTKDLVVTPKEMDEELLHLADVMAAALNRALHPDFDRL